MELVIGLIVLVAIGVFVFRPKKEADAAPVAEYKVETPTPVAEQATQAVVESLVEAPAKKPRAKKAPAAKKTTTRKPKAK